MDEKQEHPARESADGVANPSRILGTNSFGGPTRIVRLVAAAAALSVLGGLVAVGGASPAGASNWNYNFDAVCENDHSVTAWAPDLTHDSGSWATVWAPTLYRWTNTGWQRYRPGPTWTEYGGNWTVQSYNFPGLPQGYYQVRDTYAWVYNGVKTSSAVLQPVTHYRNGAGAYWGAGLSTWYYSTPGYCYMS